MKPGSLIAFRNDRLGARLISLVNAVRLARDHDLAFQVYWPEAVDIGHVFNDPTELFDPGFVADHFIDSESWQQRRRAAERIGHILSRGAAWLTKTCASGRDVLVDQAFDIAVLNGEPPETVRTAFAEAMNAIPLAPDLRPLAQTLGERLRGATAYHIRRGDLTDGLKAKNKAWPHKYVPDEFYRLHMARELEGEDGQVILFSDDPASVERFRAAFPGVLTIEDLVAPGRLGQGARDLLELYAMSRCARIIAPDRSAFSSTAADLGGAVKVDVISDMDPVTRDTAHRAVADRLAAGPGAFGGDGEIGQCLAHAVNWLEARGETREAADLMAAHVGAGLNISFVYPRLMSMQHRLDDVAGALDTARIMDSRHVQHVRDFAVAEVWRGYALWRAGERDAALVPMANAFWHDPSRTEVRCAVGALVDEGRLGSANFLPADPALLDMRRRRGAVPTLHELFPALLDHPDTVDAVPALDLFAWDWDPLMRKQTVPGAVRKGLCAVWRQALVKMAAGGTADQATVDSLDALFRAHEGDVDLARDRIARVVADAPANAAVAQRQSHIALIAGDIVAAADAGERAAALGPDVPAMRAWAGLCLIRARSGQSAASHLEVAEARAPGLAAIPALLAEALDRAGDIEQALAAGIRALKLAPGEARLKMSHASRLMTLGHRDQARDTLGDLFAWDCAPQRAHSMLAEILLDEGRVAEAGSIIARGLARSPENPRLLALGRQLGTAAGRVAAG